MSYEKFKSYVTKADFDIIGTCCKDNNIAVSIRETGTHSIMRITQGAGMKPHAILEKSIKEKSILQGYAVGDGKNVTDAIDNFNRRMCKAGLHLTFNDLKGYVGSWNSQSELCGLYLTKAGVAYFTANKCMLSDGDNDRKYVDFKELSKFDTLEAQHFITGDYDIHDLIDYKFGMTSGRYVPVHEDSKQELDAINALNKALGGNEVSKLEDVRENNRFQHGAQYSYMAFAARMMVEGKVSDAEIVRNVAKMSLPVAMCNKGDWLLIETEDDLKKWYDDNKVVMKNTWTTNEHFEKLLERHKQNLARKKKRI